MAKNMQKQKQYLICHTDINNTNIQLDNFQLELSNLLKMFLVFEKFKASFYVRMVILPFKP